VQLWVGVTTDKTGHDPPYRGGMSDPRLTRRELLASGLALGAGLVVDPLTRPLTLRTPAASPSNERG